MAIASLPLFALWAYLFLYSSKLGTAAPPLIGSVFLGLFASIPSSLVVIGLGVNWIRAAPKSLRLESGGVLLEWDNGKTRRLLWTDAKKWFELRDDTHAVYPSAVRSFRFYMAGPSGLYTSMFPIPEPAFVRLLEGAKAAGVEIVSQTGIGRRMPGAIIYFVKGRMAL